jgi:general secretion pathway protein D
VIGPSNSLAYQIGTRSAATVLRLRDGETQVLAGLISNEERSSANRLPGLGDLPAIGRLFSSTRDNANKTEIVLLITPRVVRNVTRPESAINAYPAGSEANVGALPFQLRRTVPGSLSLSGSGASGAAPAAGATDAATVARPAGVNPRAAESRAAQPMIEPPADAAPAPAVSGAEPAGQPVSPVAPSAPASPNSSVILTPVAPLAPASGTAAPASPPPVKAP